jgi:pimeloyl-ACP methyl ester carboxylesterase
MLTMLLAASGARAQAGCSPADNETRVSGGPECLVIRTFRPGKPRPSPALVVFIHGDATSGGPVDYIYRMASSAVADGMITVGLVRPGYPDSAGNRSTGDDTSRSDTYTPHNVDAVAAAVRALKAHHAAGRVVLVGHSGGAAISAVILGRHPDVAGAAVLVACPCNVFQWRVPQRRRPWPNSLSPHEWAEKVPPSARVVAITGADDDNTDPGLAREYVEMLARRGVSARFVSVPGAGHNDVVRKPEVSAAIREVTRAP